MLFRSGLNLDYFFKGSNKCINSFIGSADDITYLQNNFTLVESNNGSSWFEPVLNFTGLLARNVAFVTPNCYQTFTNAKNYTIT